MRRFYSSIFFLILAAAPAGAQDKALPPVVGITEIEAVLKHKGPEGAGVHPALRK